MQDLDVQLSAQSDSVSVVEKIDRGKTRAEKWEKFKQENSDLALFHTSAYPQEDHSLLEILKYISIQFENYEYKPDEYSAWARGYDSWDYMEGDAGDDMSGDCEDWSNTFTNNGIRDGMFGLFSLKIDSGAYDNGEGHAWVELTNKETGEVWIVDCTEKLAVYRGEKYLSVFTNRQYLFEF